MAAPPRTPSRASHGWPQTGQGAQRDCFRASSVVIVLPNGPPMTHALRLSVCLALALAAATTRPVCAEAGRFSQDVALGEASIDLRVAAAVYRSDGRWLTLGTRTDADNQATPYLVLREPGGRLLAAVALQPDNARSWTASSLVDAGGGDVIVAGMDHDPTDFAAPQALFVARLGVDLDIVWSRRYGREGATLEDVSLRAGAAGAAATLVGGIREIVDDVALDGDAFVATLDPATGDVTDARTLGTPEAHERGTDVAPLASGDRAVLLEVRRLVGAGLEAGDGLVSLGADGAVAASHLAGHPISAGIRAQPFRFLADDAGLVIAGRRTAFGPNFFYLHRLGEALAPAGTRTLIPFFNASDVAATRAGGILVYGEANGEVGESGTTLMRLDSDLQIALQRRYETRNQAFPSGAIAHGDSGLLLALGAMRDDDALVFEAVNRVDADDGEGLLCEEGPYDGFDTAVDTQVANLAWTPATAPLQLTETPVAAKAAPLGRTDIGECALPEDLVYRDGFGS